MEPCRCGFRSLSVACSLCLQRRDGPQLREWYTGFLDRVGQPRSAADAHQAAAAWDGRQVRLERGGTVADFGEFMLELNYFSWFILTGAMLNLCIESLISY